MSPGRSLRHLVRGSLAVACLALGVSSAWAQETARPPAGHTGSIEGTVSAQSGSLQLPGVVISIRDASDEEAAQQISSEDGHFAVSDLPPARYRVRASLDGFETVEKDADVLPGGTVHVALDLSIAAASEHIEVVARAPVSDAGTIATTEAVAATEAQLMTPGDGVKAALRLMSGVIDVPGGQSIAGGRPYQAGMQLGGATLVESGHERGAAVAAFERHRLGVGPVESLRSGVRPVLVRPRGRSVEARGRRLERQRRQPRAGPPLETIVAVGGDGNFSVEAQRRGGRAAREGPRLSPAECTVLLPDDRRSQPSRRGVEDRRVVQLVHAPRREPVVAALAVACRRVRPGTSQQATLGTFVPPDATVDIDELVGHGTITERAFLGAATAVETTLEIHAVPDRRRRPGAGADGKAAGDDPRATSSTCSSRSTSTYQWIETASRSQKEAGGLHLFKAGLDLLHSSYEGTSGSTSVLIRTFRRDAGPAARLRRRQRTIGARHRPRGVRAGPVPARVSHLRRVRRPLRSRRPSRRSRPGRHGLASRGCSTTPARRRCTEDTACFSSGRRRSLRLFSSSRRQPTRGSPRTGSRRSDRRCSTGT